MSTLGSLRICGCATGALVLATSAAAQDAGPARPSASPSAAASAADAPAGLEDIVVTARRSNERMQDTPVAVTALSELALERTQVVAVADLQRAAPNLSIAVGGSGATSLVYVSIRGQGQNSPNSTGDPAVGTYIDGVYFARPTSGNVDLVDVARAEVLRGPQGTLFGRNTTGGALNIVTNQPTGTFEGMIKAGIGNYDQRRIEAMLNVPLAGDELAARVVGRYEERDGYGRFVTIDRPASDIKSNVYVRGHLRWAPESIPLELTVSGDYSRFLDSGQLTGLRAFNADLDLGGITVGDALALVGIDPNAYLLNKDNFYKSYGYGDTGTPDLDTPYDKTISDGVSANAQFDLGGVKLTSITAYRESRVSVTQDLESLPVNMYTFTSVFNQHQFSQELQLSGKSGPLQWIGGLYYFREKGLELAQARAFAFLNPAAPVGQNTYGNTNNSSVAAFGQVNYQITDRLRATAGIRYTWDRRKLVLHNATDRTDPASCVVVRDVPGGPCDQTRVAKFDYPAWTAGLDFKVDENTLLYAKTSGASMAGGWNIRDSFAPAFKPEDVRDVEAGLKTELFDRRLRANLAVFHAWQSDVQRVINTFDPVFGGATQYVVNAGKAKVYGVELELTLTPWQGMTINSSIARQHAAYVDGTFLETQVVGGVPVEVDRSDERVPQAPKTTFNIGATQSFPVSFGEVSVHADYAYVGSPGTELEFAL